MIVFHGTGDYNLDGFKTSLPTKRPRSYLNWRKAFSTTTNFDIATLFAMRRTSSDDILAGKVSGIVLEFELSGCSCKDYQLAKDRGVLQNEAEIAVFNVRKLKMVALWRYDDGEWKRGIS